MYSSTKFAAFTNLSIYLIRECYSKGITNGEDIIEHINNLERKTQVCITYNDKIYDSTGFSELTGIPAVTVLKYFKKGIYDGSQIIFEYNRNKDLAEAKLYKIKYKGSEYTCKDFCRVAGIGHNAVQKYYKQGITDGEAIIAAVRGKKSRAEKRITYNGKSYSVPEFSELSKIPESTIYRYWRNGISAGEEIIAALNAHSNNILIPYKGSNYTIAQLSKEFNTYYMRVYTYYLEGYRTGEEILATYNRNKRKVIEFPYNGNIYTMTQFSELTKISRATVFNYYKKGVRTGEEMIERYNRNKH